MNPRMFVLVVVLKLLTCVPAALGEPVEHYWAREEQLNEWFVESLSKSVVLLQNESAGSYQTGVLVAGIAGEDDSRIFILTNNHLLKTKDDNVSVFISNLKKGQERFATTLLKSDPDLDLAVFSLSTSEKRLEELIDLGFTVSADSSSVRIPDTNSGLSVSQGEPKLIRRGRSVLFLGFPLKAGTKTAQIMRQVKIQGTNEIIDAPLRLLIEKEPIARFGHIASSSDGNFFLIDAMVNHGNSGSPVFVRDGDTSSTGVTNKYLLIGIIRGFKADDIVFKADDGEIISIPHNSGLSEVISIETIKKFMTGL